MVRLTSDFDESYKGTPPWDIGRPQNEFLLLEKRGEIKGSILDIGCGTGENSLYFANLGHQVVGVDLSSRAIEKARAKAKERKIENVTFEIMDALKLSRLERTFDNELDCGLFHTFTDVQRKKYVKSLQYVLAPGGKYFMLCFSDLEPEGWGGPRRVTQEEIRGSFSAGWKANYINDARLETRFHSDGGRAWLSSITRI